jgi:hypothetical protein
MQALVIDGSTALGFLMHDEQHPDALKSLEAIESGIPTFVPAHWCVEVANGLVMAFTAAEVRELSTKAGAFTLPSGSKDASLLFTTSTNTSYTVLVSGAAGETGVALVEVYDVTGL